MVWNGGGLLNNTNNKLNSKLKLLNYKIICAIYTIVVIAITHLTLYIYIENCILILIKGSNSIVLYCIV